MRAQNKQVRQLQKKQPSHHIEIGDHVIVIALIVFWFLLMLTNSSFRNFKTYSNIIKQGSMFAVCGIGMTYVMIAGEMDMSVASIIAMLSVIFTQLVNKIAPTNPTAGIWLTCTIILVIGTLCGTFNGLLVAKLHIPSFIATLAMQNIYRGIAQLICKDPVPIANLGQQYLSFSTGANKAITIGQITEDFSLMSIKGFSFTKILGLPLFFWLMVALAIAGTIILRKSALGRYILAIGNSKSAARISGINIPRTQISMFAVLGLFTGVTALMMTSNQGSSNYGVPTGTEFTVISAVILGGTNPKGGKGSVFNTVIAAMFMATIPTALTMFKIPNTAHGIFNGCVLVIAFSINTIRTIIAEISVKNKARKTAQAAASQAEQPNWAK